MLFKLNVMDIYYFSNMELKNKIKIAYESLIDLN
jgi:hypothetical protein